MLAKRAAKGNSSPVKNLPTFLRKTTPTSIAALCQENKSKIQCVWKRCWKDSPHRKLTDKIDKSTPSKKWMNLTKPLTCKQASILIQLQTSHVGLNKHLHRIKHATSPKCTNCTKNADETVSHFLLVCTWYQDEWFILHRALRRHTSELSFLLNYPTALLPLLKYIQATGWFKQTFSPTILPIPLLPLPPPPPSPIPPPLPPNVIP